MESLIIAYDKNMHWIYPDLNSVLSKVSFSMEWAFGFLTSFHQMRAFSVFRGLLVWSFVVFRPLRVYLILTSILYPFEFLRSFAVLDHYVHNWPLRVFYTLLRCWRRLWRLARYVYNWSLRVFYTLLSLSRRLWHLDHYVYVWPSRLFRPFCVFDIVSRVRPLLNSI